MAQSVEQEALRAETVSTVVNGFALQEFKLKPLLTLETSTSAKETFQQETSTELTAAGQGRNVKGVPRLAQPPTLQVTWTEKSAYLQKHMGEAVISWEDSVTAEISVIARTLLRVARAISYSTDLAIWDVLSESQSVVNINSLAIAANAEWDSANLNSQDPIANLLNARQLIEESNYDMTTGGVLLLNPKNKRTLLSNANVRNAGQFFTDAPTRNGVIGRICGLKVIVSPVVTADYCMILKEKECATWHEAAPLKTIITEDPGIKFTIRSFAWGVAQLTNPKAICLVSNTDA